MKKLILILSFFSVFTLVKAQNDSMAYDRAMGLTLFGMEFPTFKSSDFNTDTIALTTFQGAYGGLSFSNRIKDEVYFKVGLYVTQRVYKTDITSSKTFASTDTILYSSLFNGMYISIPFIIQWKVWNTDKMAILPEIGIIPSLLMMKDKSEVSAYRTLNGDVTQSSDHLYKTANSVTNLSVGVQFNYEFNDHMGLFCNPFVKYYFDNLNKDLFKDKGLSFGGLFGLYYGF